MINRVIKVNFNVIFSKYLFKISVFPYNFFNFNFIGKYSFEYIYYMVWQFNIFKYVCFKMYFLAIINFNYDELIKPLIPNIGLSVRQNVFK